MLTGLGPVTLRAEQAGDDFFLPASAQWTVTVTAPRLGLRREDGEVELFWAAGLAGFKLQSAESLAPASQWQDTTASPAEANGEASLRFDKTAPQQYFRLLKP